MDLYYDPVVDEHVPSPLGLIAPVWYLAPQRPDVARSAWELAVSVAGLDGDSTVGLEDPGFASLLALQTGEFDDGRIRRRLWEALDDLHEPTRGVSTGRLEPDLRTAFRRALHGAHRLRRGLPRRRPQ